MFPDDDGAVQVGGVLRPAQAKRKPECRCQTQLILLELLKDEDMMMYFTIKASK